MSAGRWIMRAAPLFNAPVVALAQSRRFGGFLRGSIATVSYEGRRSGKAVSLPVSYRRRGDEVTIAVAMPDAKSWWRNFLGDGAPLAITLDGRERSGHAVAHRDDKGSVTVGVRLDPAPDS